MAASIRSLRQWEDSAPRPQTQPEAESRETRKARRAARRQSLLREAANSSDPVVINSILDSFDAFAPSLGLEPEEVRTYTPTGRSRPHTANDTAASFVRTRAGPRVFGVGHGSGLPMDDGNDQSSIAGRWIERTDGLPWDVLEDGYERAGLTGVADGAYMRRTGSLSSGRSFPSRKKPRDSPTRNKLSSESWVKQGAIEQPIEESGWPLYDAAQSVRQPSPPEALRVPKSRVALTPSPPLPRTMSRAEQIIAATPVARPSSKRRIYLSDTASNDSNSIISSSLSTMETTKPESSLPTLIEPQAQSIDSAVQSILDEYVRIEEAQQVPMATSPNRRSSIIDSIPMRTSSLRVPSESPARERKKERKARRKTSKVKAGDQETSSKRNSFVSASSRAISDSTWNDLDEDDETVKRIRELREQRNARLLDPAVPLVRSLSPAAVSDASSAGLSDQLSARSEDVASTQSIQPEAGRDITEPGHSRRPIARAETYVPSTGINNEPLDRRKANGPTAETHRRATNLSLDETRLNARPSSARSDASSSAVYPSNLALSLDYSYADAMDALQGARRNIAKKSQTSPGSPSSPLARNAAASSGAQSPKEATPSIRSKGFKWRFLALQQADGAGTSLRSLHRKSVSVDRSMTTADPPADTADSAVNDYLRADRLNRKIKDPQSGRIISFSEVGDPNGAAVIVCLGMGLTRYITAFYDELAATLRLRLISIDRPGVGNSEPYPAGEKTGPLSWPDDVLAVCQHIGIAKFSMLAHSAGAIYALATALTLPHLISGKLHLLSPWIPPSQLEVPSSRAASISPGGALPRSQRFLRVLPAPFFRAANASFMTATSASLSPARRNSSRLEPRQNLPHIEDRTTSSNNAGLKDNRRESLMLMDQYMPEMQPNDKYLVTDSAHLISNGAARPQIETSTSDASFQFASTGPNGADNPRTQPRSEYIALLTQRTWELATKDSNPATDLLVCLERNREIGFRYTDVQQQVVITHGADDKRVPVGNVRWLAEQMNRKSAVAGASPGGSGSPSTDPVEGNGCEIRVLQGEGHGLMASPSIMGDILAEIAGDWNRAF